MYHKIKAKKHPYIENPEEIQGLLEVMESEEIKEFVRKSFYKYQMSIGKIGKKFEEYGIEIYITKPVSKIGNLNCFHIPEY